MWNLKNYAIHICTKPNWTGPTRKKTILEARKRAGAIVVTLQEIFYALTFAKYTVSQKNRTPITFWNNSNKLCLIIIMISWENRQKVLNIVVCYELTIFRKSRWKMWINWSSAWWREVWSGLQQTVVDDAIDEWRRRLWACVRVKGQHFEHLL